MCEMVVDGSLDGKKGTNRQVADIRLEFSPTRMWYAVVMMVDIKVFLSSPEDFLTGQPDF